MAGLVCGVDIGGTFTDCVLIGGRRRPPAARRSSPPADSFQSGFFSRSSRPATARPLRRPSFYTRMRRLISPPFDRRDQHRRRAQGGPRIGLITTRGFEDTVPTMRGLGRPTGEPPENLLRFAETPQARAAVSRSSAPSASPSGSTPRAIVVALNEEAVAAAADALLAAGVDTIAIAFLWSVRNAPTSAAPARSSPSAPPASSSRSRANLEGGRRVRALRRHPDQLLRRPGHQHLPARVQDRLAESASPASCTSCSATAAWSRSASAPTGRLHDRLRPVGGLIGCARVADDLGPTTSSPPTWAAPVRRRHHQGRRAARRRRHPARQVALRVPRSR